MGKIRSIKKKIIRGINDIKYESKQKSKPFFTFICGDTKMKVLMFGWEFPPYNKGGLGTACHGLAKGLSKNGIQVTFVIPKALGKLDSDFVDLISAEDCIIDIQRISSPLSAYMTPEEYQQEILRDNFSPTKKIEIYGKDLFLEVERYARKAGAIAKEKAHDVIHAHDWMAYKAGIAAKKISGKPFIAHVHATEFDRTGGNGVNQYVYSIEREGLHAADRIIAVSQFTKDKIVEHYGITPEKIEVIHNAVEFNKDSFRSHEGGMQGDKVVLFLGRITLQKGPDYFLYAAKKVLEYMDNVTFIIVGSGDMQPFLIEKSAQLGIADKFLFTGFLQGKEVDRAYRMANLYVMPSVSEPFGITPLEAMRNNVPVIISKQSGVSEVISHCLKVDFWDVDEMASKIISVLEHQELHSSLCKNGSNEVRKFNWETPARKCIDIYNRIVNIAVGYV